MNRETIISEYKSLSDAVASIEAKRKELDKDENLSNQGKQDALERFVDALGITSKTERLSADLEAVIDGLGDKWSSELVERLKNKEYQDALNAAADAIAGGYLSDPHDLETVAAMFAGDIVAIRRLNAAAIGRKIVVASLNPIDHRERVLGNLQSMVADVKSITPASVKADGVAARFKIAGNLEYIQERLDDGFNYIPHTVERVG